LEIARYFPQALRFLTSKVVGTSAPSLPANSAAALR
jgi:hypothetical protein